MKIAIREVGKRFGSVFAVDHVSLDVLDGELFTLLGPSGCGKTTLLRLIAGFHRPDAGRIRFGERDVTDLPPYARNIGMVFQNYALWPHMTVFQNVAYGLRLRRLRGAEIEARVAEGLRKVNLSGRLRVEGLKAAEGTRHNIASEILGSIKAHRDYDAQILSIWEKADSTEKSVLQKLIDAVLARQEMRGAGAQRSLPGGA